MPEVLAHPKYPTFEVANQNERMNSTPPARDDTSKPWYATWFDTEYYRLLYRHRNESEAASFLQRLLHYLNLPSQARILDLACGRGRHTRIMAQHGYRVVGIDIAANALQEAQRQASPNEQYILHDMRHPLPQGPYDLICNLFTSFGYFDSDDEDQQVFYHIAAALKPQGDFIIDYLNADYTTAHLRPYETRQENGVQFHIHRQRTPTHIIKTIRCVDPSGNEQTFYERVRLYTVEDFHRMAHKAGLTPLSHFGDYHLRAFHPKCSPRIIVHFRKNDGQHRGATDAMG